jgi:hypothetical protein
MALAGPRSEEKQDLGALLASERVPLVRLEVRERPGRPLDALAAGVDLGLPVDDQDPRMLLHLVVAELLPGIEPDEHRARLVLALQDDRRAAPVGRLDRRQIPGFHGASSVTAPG